MEEKIKKPQRKYKSKYSIAYMQAFAKAKGGKCLSDEYKGLRNKLQWQCKEGHTWFAQPNQIINNKTWCRICGTKRMADAKKSTIEQMKQVAKERGGKCLSDIYLHSHSKLQWQCSKGHVWNATSGSIVHGTWCRKCHYLKLGESIGANIKTYQKIALERNGKCLSTEYINMRTKLQWQCSKGHVWMANPNLVKRGTWCPYCAHNTIYSIKDIQIRVGKYGGKCLSKEYVRDKPLTWECAKGHVWNSTWKHVKAGFWCKVCKREKKIADKKLLQDSKK